MMQKKTTKGLFIDSSYRRTGLLKTLLRGFRNEREEKEAGETTFGQNDRTFAPPSELKTRADTDNTHMKKAASI